MNLKNLFIGLVIGIAITMFSTQVTHANEGRFLLLAQNGRDYRCLAFSVETKLSEYEILVSCRGLIYPPQPPELDSYILWADGGNQENPVKLADLSFGKASAKLKNRFTRLFVTLEKGSPKTPTGPIAMQGTIQTFNFETTQGINLEPVPTNTPTQTISPTDETTTPEATTEAETNRSSFWQTTFGKIILVVTAGFIIFIVIVIVYSRRN